MYSLGLVGFLLFLIINIVDGNNWFSQETNRFHHCGTDLLTKNLAIQTIGISIMNNNIYQFLYERIPEMTANWTISYMKYKDLDRLLDPFEHNIDLMLGKKHYFRKSIYEHLRKHFGSFLFNGGVARTGGHIGMGIFQKDDAYLLDTIVQADLQTLSLLQLSLNHTDQTVNEFGAFNETIPYKQDSLRCVLIAAEHRSFLMIYYTGISNNTVTSIIQKSNNQTITRYLCVNSNVDQLILQLDQWCIKGFYPLFDIFQISFAFTVYLHLYLVSISKESVIIVEQDLLYTVNQPFKFTMKDLHSFFICNITAPFDNETTKTMIPSIYRHTPQSFQDWTTKLSPKMETVNVTSTSLPTDDPLAKKPISIPFILVILITLLVLLSILACLFRWAFLLPNKVKKDEMDKPTPPSPPSPSPTASTRKTIRSKLETSATPTPTTATANMTNIGSLEKYSKSQLEKKIYKSPSTPVSVTKGPNKQANISNNNEHKKPKSRKEQTK